MVYIYLAAIYVTVTHLGVTWRRGVFLALITAETNMISFCSIILFVYLIIK